MNINQVTSQINNFLTMINSAITKVVPMPAILLLCACMSRQGLSPMRSLSNVCKSLEDLGIPMGSNPDGSTNLIVATSYALLKEIYRAQTEDAVVQGSLESASMQIMSSGANAAGAVVSTGTNLLPVHLWGVIQ